MRGKVYVMSNDKGQVKIGWSKAPTTRAKQLKAKLEYATEMYEGAPLLEEMAHKIMVLRCKQAHGEWFDGNVSDAIASIEKAIDQHEGREFELQGRYHRGGDKMFMRSSKVKEPRGVGRPAKDDADRATRRMLRVNDVEWEKIKDLAHARRLSAAEYIRRCALHPKDDIERQEYATTSS